MGEKFEGQDMLSTKIIYEYIVYPLKPISRGLIKTEIYNVQIYGNIPPIQSLHNILFFLFLIC